MTADEVRLLALALPQVRYVAQLGGANLMIGDKVFATLGAPDPSVMVLKLTPEAQAQVIAANPRVFAAQRGGAGARGLTCVKLAAADAALVQPVLAAAYRKAADAKSQRTVFRA